MDQNVDWSERGCWSACAASIREPAGVTRQLVYALGAAEFVGQLETFHSADSRLVDVVRGLPSRTVNAPLGEWARFALRGITPGKCRLRKNPAALRRVKPAESGIWLQQFCLMSSPPGGNVHVASDNDH